MDDETITITLGRGARESKSATSGFKGGACKEALKPFSELLGTVQSSQNTAEFYEAEACNRERAVEGQD